MFRLLRKTNIDFMSKRKVMLGLSLTLVLASIAVVLVMGLNLGIEFTGGTELQIKYSEEPRISEIRDQLAQAGMSGAAVTTIGRPEEHEVYIRLAVGGLGSDEEVEDPTSLVVAALRGGEPASNDLNVIDRQAMAELLRAGSAQRVEQRRVTLEEVFRRLVVEAGGVS